ncbi:MAG TPA: hypothetical protein VFC73_07750 [Syntrophomonadaceae bacterium]|nr:hypothetical protein [Syntrophomonadaceae bacterium]
MLRSKLVKTLLFIFVIWLVVTIYFYTQHQMTLQRHLIDETIALENATVVINDAILWDVERKNIDFVDDWRYDFASILPALLQFPFLKLCSFYNKPYQEIKYGFSKIEFRGKILLKNKIVGEEHQELWDNYDFGIVDEAGVNYCCSYSSTYEGGNILYIAMKGDFFKPDLTEINIIINDKLSDHSELIPVRFNWQSEKYNFFKKPPFKLSVPR